MAGRLVVLDGAQRLGADTLASLARLLHDREACLPDGTRLLPPSAARHGPPPPGV